MNPLLQVVERERDTQEAGSMITILRAALDKEREFLFISAWNATWTLQECADLLRESDPTSAWSASMVYRWAKRLQDKPGTVMRPTLGRNNPRPGRNQQLHRWVQRIDGKWYALHDIELTLHALRSATEPEP